ncbi:hypothetical protein [Methanothermococcus okinawensis]|uniref:Uncharacterized protein n=1 Tax=Methanothermococcus okinawensis (strain DSM 14208 / JCM 11175 / IH1) TaxID=647113 RepID=F8ALI7_METOI|nr:hypothetical protein [Methanothermococcus okinawensis]AEH07081.1 hypothetical protein Metok_1112 [Methanothermococcus okinawensis IH1]
MCYGEVGIIKGFVYKCDVKIPLVELGENILEMALPLTDDVKIGDKIMVYNSYKFDYEFKPIEINISDSMKSLKTKIKTKLNILYLKKTLIHLFKLSKYYHYY